MDAEPPAAPVWMTVAEFAAMLRLPKSSVYEAVAAGRLEHRRVGKSIRIHRDAGFIAASTPTHRRRPQRRQIVVVRRQRRSA